jgi:hypothetical protein
MAAYVSGMDRESLLIELHAGRERLRHALAGLPDGAMLDHVDEEWTRKDVLAHLEAWERRVVELFERLRRGETPAESPETDELNARFFALDRDRSLGDVRRGEEGAWLDLLAVVDAASDEELFRPDRFAWTDGDPFVRWITGNADEHFDEHLDQLTRPARTARPSRPAALVSAQR